MRNPIKAAFCTLCAFAFIAVAASAHDHFDMEKTFEAKSLVEIRTVSGDCIVKKGLTDKIEVAISASYDPEDSFEPEFSEKGNRLVVEEIIHGSNSGSATWTIIVPENTDISFSSASGDLEISGLNNDISVITASGDILISNGKGELDIATASGSVDISNCSGQISVSLASGNIVASRLSGNVKLATASGDIEVREMEGRLKVGSASGSVSATDIKVTQRCSFGAASGDVEVKLAASQSAELSLSSASGKAVLNYNGNPVSGYFELTAQVDHGKIKAPFKFDREEEFHQNGEDYVTKSFTKGADSPEIFIETASGVAVLEE